MTSSIDSIAVVGSGYMGGGIAQVLAWTGRPCVLADIDETTATRALARLVREADRFEELGLFPPGSAATISSNLSAASSVEEAVANADYITEAVPEVPALKHEILGRISTAAKPSALIATNTSAIPIAELSESVAHTERFLGVHWMNPAPFVPAVEVISGPETADQVLTAAETLLSAAGKVTTRVSDIAGFIANRLQFALYKEALTVVEEGMATPEEVDRVVSNSFGFRLALFGPFAIGDMAGLDVYAGAYRTLEEAYGERFAMPAVLAAKVADGELGTKTEGGFLSVDPSELNELAVYRDRAYQALQQLKSTLGPPPGLSTS